MSRLRKKTKTAKRQRQRSQRRRQTTPDADNDVDDSIKPSAISSHQYYSKMNYDGNTLSVESQQDNQPIQRKKYTLKQLRREIPVAAELINKYLDGKVPHSLHNHQHPPHTVSIYPVLPNPVDLGLIPPATTAVPTTDSRRGARIRNIGDEFRPISMSSDCSPSTCESKKRNGRNTTHRRKHHIGAADAADAADADQMMKLFVSEKDDNDRDDDDHRKIQFF